jgi:hypothetical protein
MTKPKSTRKGRSAPTIAERARAIVNNPGRYDEETRHAINNMLRENSKDLAEFVRRAESGEEIFDLVHPLPNPLPTAATLPELIAAVLAHKDTPAALYNAMRDALGGLPGFSKALDSAPFIAELLKGGE